MTINGIPPEQPATDLRSGMVTSITGTIRNIQTVEENETIPTEHLTVLLQFLIYNIRLDSTPTVDTLLSTYGVQTNAVTLPSVTLTQFQTFIKFELIRMFQWSTVPTELDVILPTTAGYEIYQFIYRLPTSGILSVSQFQSMISVVSSDLGMQQWLVRLRIAEVIFQQQSVADIAAMAGMDTNAIITDAVGAGLSHGFKNNIFCVFPYFSGIYNNFYIQFFEKKYGNV